MHDSSTHSGKPTVLVLGGTGFVGQALVSELLDRGYGVSVASRTPHNHPELSRRQGLSLLQWNGSVIDDLLPGHDVLVNLVGILNEPVHNGKTFEKVHVDLTRAILVSAHKAGLKRYLHMSALGAHATAGSSFYQRSKGKAEDLAHAFGYKNGIGVTSFRPSVIFGANDSFLNRFAQLARLMPGIFPLACPQARFSPVYVGDVVRCMADALDNPSSIGRRIDLCGPQDYTLEEIVRYAAQASGHPRRIVPLPDWLTRLQAHVLEWVPGQPFTRDNYASLQVPNTCPADCPRQPTRLEDVWPPR